MAKSKEQQSFEATRSELLKKYSIGNSGGSSSASDDVMSALMQKYGLSSGASSSKELPASVVDAMENLRKKYLGSGDSQSDFLSLRNDLLSKYSDENAQKNREAVSSWSKRFESVMSGFSQYENQRNGGYTRDASGGYASEIDALMRDYGTISGYAGRYGLPNAQRYYKQLQQIKQYIGDTNTVMSQFEDEDAYNRYLTGQRGDNTPSASGNSAAPAAAAPAGGQRSDRPTATWREKYSSLSEDERRQYRDRLQREYYDAIDEQIQATGESLHNMPASDDMKSIKAQLDELDAMEGELQIQRNLAEREEAISAYDNNRSDPAFSQTAQAGRNGTYSRRDDPLGYYLANREEIEIHNAISGNADSSWSELTDDETDMYYYLLASQGSKAAKKYLDDMQIQLDKRIHDKGQKNIAALYNDASTAGKVGLNALTVPANVLGSIAAPIGDAASVLSGKGFNPYNNGHTMQDYASKVRGLTAQDIVDTIGEDNQFWGQVASNTYQALMSGVDSAVGATMFGKGYTVVMGSGAASQRARELWESGASDVQIGMGAMASGLIEMATEKFSVEYFTENFLKGDITGFKDWMVKTLIQGFNEGSEEIASELANLAADALIMGANSDNQREVRELMDSEGMSREEAEKAALMNRALDVLWAGYGGLVSGGGMGALGGAVKAGSQMITGKTATATQTELAGPTLEGEQRSNENTMGTPSQQSQEDAAEATQNLTENSGHSLDFNISEDTERGTLNITFPEKPSPEVQATLKDNGFRWSKRDKLWFGNGEPAQTRQAIQTAMDGKEAGSAKSTTNMASDKGVGSSGEHTVTADLSFPSDSATKKSSSAAAAARPFEISSRVGKTMLNREDGSRVETRITGIASNKKGELLLNVAGQSEPVSAENISYSNSGEAALYQAIHDMDITPAAAKEFVTQAHRAGDTTGEFAMDVYAMYQLGEQGIPKEKALHSKYGASLTETMREFGYFLGKRTFDAENGGEKAAAVAASTEQSPATELKNADAPGSTNAKAVEKSDVDILRQAISDMSTLDLSEAEKNALNVYGEKMKELDTARKTVDTLSSKTAPLNGYERGQLKNSEKQIRQLTKKLEGYAQKYPLLQSVSEKMRKRMQEQYGTIPAGENPVRVAEIPGRTDANNRVSKTVGTAIEAKVTTDEAAKKIQEKTTQGDFSYLPITDESAKQRAADTIKRKGWNDALSDWRVGMSKTGFPGKDMVTLGFELYNNAVNSGDTKTAVQILTDITNTVRNSAQVVQAVRILKQLSPENRLYAIQRQLDSLQEELNNRYGDKAPQIDMNSTLAENYRNAQGAENIRVAEEALFRDIAAKLPNTFADKWNSWRYLSMLGNVRTHVRNILGNIGFVPVRATKDLIASGIEAGVNSISKDGISRTKGVLLATNKADRALYKAGLSDFAAAEELIGSPNVKSQDSISKIEQMRPAFGGDKAIWRALSKVAEANGNALSMEDTLFKKVTYASAFGGYLKSNGITAQMLQNGEVTDSFMDDARAYAFNEALKATYNDFNDFSNFVANIGNLRHSGNTVAKAAGFLVEGVLPFKRTPANIVARSVEYSPIGMVNGIKQSLVDVHRGKVTAAEAIDNVASGLTGTLLLGLGALLANMGVVSGGDDEDDKQKKFDQLRGKQSYAINAFGGSYTIDWLAPEVIPMFVGVELYNRVNSDGSLQFKDLLDSISRVSNPLLEMSCMSSLNDLLDSISYSDNKLYSVFSQAAANHILQALPTVFGQLERMGETEREQTYIDNSSQLPKDLQYTIAKAANKIPGVEFEQIPYIDAYGRRQESGSLGTRIFSNGFSPGYLGSDKSAPWDDELQRLYDLGYSSVLPSAAAKKIGDRDLTADEYVRYATFTGQEKYRLLGEVTSSEYFQQSSDADREEIIKGVYSYVNAAGSKLIDADRDIAAWTEKAMNMEKLGIPFADFLRMKNTALNENGNVTKDVYVSYIRQNFPANKQAEVWAIMKNSSWKDSGTPWG